MSIQQLCADLEQLGVTLTAVNGRLRVSAPVGVVTTDLRQRLHEGRDEVLATLPNYRWRVILADGRELEICSLPQFTESEITACYPDAASVKPAPAVPRRQSTAAESGELARLIGAVYRNDTDGDRAEALTLALADPVSALVCYRALARVCAAVADGEDSGRT